MNSDTTIESLKKEYGSLFTSISEALFKADPGRVNFERVGWVSEA